MVSYGRPALDELRRLVAVAKSSDAMSPITILVPSDIAGVSVRRALARGVGGRTGVVAVTVTTLGRLAETMTAGRMGERRPATQPILTAAWRHALAVAPGGLGAVAEHPATVRALMRAQSELRDLDDAQLVAIEAGGALAGDVVRLLREVRGATGAWYDETDILEMATFLMGAGTVSPATRAVLYLPQQLSEHEVAFLRTLVDAGQVDAVVGLSSDARADGPVFAGVRRAGFEMPDYEQPTPVVATRVVHASDSDDEVRWVVRDVLRALAERPGHRIAVLYPAADPYARLLHDHLAAAGIAVAGPGVSPVRERAVARGILAVLSLPADDFARADVFAALGQAPVRRADGRRTPTGQWERLSREAGVVGGDDWAVRLDAYATDSQARVDALGGDPDVSASRLEGLRRGIDDAVELRDFVGRWRQAIADGQALRSWPELAQWALGLFRELFDTGDGFERLPAEEKAAVATIETVFAALGELAAIEPVASYETLRDVVESELDAARPSVGRFGDGVYLAPISQAIGLDVDRVYAVGLAEDTFPGRLTPDPVLPDSVRELAGGDLRPARAQIDAKRRQWAAALALDLTATFPRGNLRKNTQRLPGRWLLPSLQALASDPALVAANWSRARGEGIVSSQSYWSELRRTSLPATEQEWRVRLAAAGGVLDDPQLTAALALTTARAGSTFTRFDGDLRGVSGLPDFAHSDAAVAPTTLEGYAGCPHSYFVQRLLGVRPNENPEEIVRISPLERGSLIHRSLDRLVEELRGQLPGYGEPWTHDHKLLLREIALEEGTSVAAHGMSGHPRLWEHELKVILDDLDWMLDDDSQKRAADGRRVLSSELFFGRNGEPPVRVSVAGGTVYMAGSIDRVDERPDGSLYVIDVKTGGASRFKAIGTDMVVGGTKLQLPAYALAARAKYGRDSAEAAYWFASGRDRGVVVPVNLDADTERIYGAAVGTLVAGIADGVFIAKPPTTEDHGYIQCPYCNPDGVSYSEVQSAYGRKRGDPALASLLALIDPVESTTAEENA
jgi:ATP-dependent helicase/nuclease subunit B